jgi:hypothetical protein
MAKRIVYLIPAFVLLDCMPAAAMDSGAYAVMLESLFLFLSLVCLIIATTIYAVLKGGSLGTPWIFFMGGFALAAASAAIQLLDMFQIVLHQYDIRPGIFIARVGSMALFMVGLFLHKRGVG